jgi:hypothetical protein
MNPSDLHVVFGTGQVGSQGVEHPFVMSDARIRALLPLTPTPLAAQMRATAQWIRALPAA